MPVELVFSQEFASRIEALAAEQQVKGWSRKKKEAMMRGDWAEVSKLAKSRESAPINPSTEQPLAPLNPSTGSGRTGFKGTG